MSQNDQAITLTARWEHDQVPQGQAARRGLLIEIETDPVEQTRTERPPVNLALVIDRSGSMAGGPLSAALEAAIGVARQLGPEDRLSVVAYDDRVDTLVDALPMDAEGRKRAERAIGKLRARGTTDLAGGWLEGARCVARAMDEHGFKAGHVVLLTDGCANRGECDPERLYELASDLAERRVTSTCVGIGEHYSPLQVTSIAEGGLGEVHQSSEPFEIIEVLSGEIGEQLSIVARDFTVRVEGLGMRTARQLTRYRTENRTAAESGSPEFRIGNLVAGQKRQVALMVAFEPEVLGREGEERHTVTASWLDPDRAMSEHQAVTTLTLDVAPPERYDENRKDKEVTKTIATLWLARQGYDAMLMNEKGDLIGAAAVMDQEREQFAEMVDCLEIPEFLSAHDDVRRRVSRQWDGLSKKEAMMMARKRMRAKPDFRAAKEGREWTDVDPE